MTFPSKVQGSEDVLSVMRTHPVATRTSFNGFMCLIFPEVENFTHEWSRPLTSNRDGAYRVLTFLPCSEEAKHIGLFAMLSELGGKRGCSVLRAMPGYMQI